MAGNTFLIEKRLYQLSPDLHKRVKESLFVLQKLLSDYLIYFPEFTDHAETHSVALIDYCNNLMGEDIINQMNEDELYILLMGCYLHDVGMGISENDYHEFCQEIDFGDYFETHEDAAVSDVIRAYHNDFSACFIKKYAQLFDFPSEKHVFAVMQSARGHRKADLFDEQAFPIAFELDNGNTVCLPYLAAIIRLADEVNVAEDRNIKLMFDPEKASTEKQRMENAKHEAIKKMIIYPYRIELDVKTESAEVYAAVANLAVKLQRTLDYCIKVVDERTGYQITQRKVIIKSLK